MKILLIFFALMFCVVGICQPKNSYIAYCVNEKEGITDSDKVKYTTIFKKCLKLSHEKPSKFKLTIQYMPNSDSEEKLNAAKSAINELAKLAASVGIKRPKEEYVKYNPEMYRDCNDVEILIFFDH